MPLWDNKLELIHIADTLAGERGTKISLTGGFDDFFITVPLQDNVLCYGEDTYRNWNEVKGAQWK